MREVKDIGFVENIFEIQKGKKVITNSFYFLNQFLEVINNRSLFYIQNINNFVLLEYKPQIQSYELFYFIEDLKLPISLETNNPVVMEIPYRGFDFYPEVIVNYWNNLGFEKHINRDLYSLRISDFNITNNLFDGLEIKLVKNSNDSNFVLELLNNTFDKFTGDILGISEIEMSIQNNNILGAFFENELVGFIRFYTKGKVSWIGHIATSPDYLGRGIGKFLVSYYLKYQITAGFENFQHWVVSDNLPALKLYNHFGFQKSNKSSISLIKK